MRRPDGGSSWGRGLRGATPRGGLDLSVEGRGLATHEDGGFGERGYRASFAFDPAPETERGLSLTLTQDYGASASGGVDALFGAAVPVEGAGAAAPERRWTAEAAYGRPAFGGRFTGILYMGYTQSETARDTNMGVRLNPDGSVAGPALTFDLKATRRESESAAPEHRIGIDLRLQWLPMRDRPAPRMAPVPKPPVLAPQQ